ncbi:MAG: hypothetical protein HY608_10985 [Planctomycetes bacterium]|nr:hypothetical protein [Planctomycetota bacterium]
MRRFLVFLLAFGSCPAVSAQEIVGEVTARDAPDDDGGRILLSWGRSAGEGPGVEYLVRARRSSGPGWVRSFRVPEGADGADVETEPFWADGRSPDRRRTVVDLSRLFAEELGSLPDDTAREGALGAPYAFSVGVLSAGADEAACVASAEATASARGNWFNRKKANNFLYTILFSGIILGFIATARRKKLFLRRIPGIDAVEEAIGRATEMGRPIYFLTGRSGMDNISTIAATTILGEVSRKVARYDTKIQVPHTNPIVMAVSQEIMKQAYIEAGRPDAFREDANFFVTEDQFSYTAAVDGMMVREKPAACFFMGYYYAEALLLAETGSSTGAIQIAGTDAEHQLPFFITTCDYTLIGEELYAASAYLSNHPVLVGTLRGQDVGKAAFMVFLAVAGVLVTVFGLAGKPGAVDPILDLFRPF